ncbi:MAG: 30S ribosomal protein S20 [Sedimentisphaeraceae bacterium JB056]
MAHSLSAKKRVRQNAKRKVINNVRKSTVKTAIKKFELAVRNHDLDSAKELLGKTTRLLDKVAATSTMHKNTASRKKSRLTKKLNAMIAKEA